jgi:hypothetical protein
MNVHRQRTGEQNKYIYIYIYIYPQTALAMMIVTTAAIIIIIIIIINQFFVYLRADSNVYLSVTN